MMDVRRLLLCGSCLFEGSATLLNVDLNLSEWLHDPVLEGTDLISRTGKLTDSTLTATRFASQRGVFVASPGYLARHGVPPHTRRMRPAPFDLTSASARSTSAGGLCLVRSGRRPATAFFTSRICRRRPMRAQPVLASSTCRTGLSTIRIQAGEVTARALSLAGKRSSYRAENRAC